ncbi:MAG: HAMP domain-containing histidine kinase [Lentimicrobium sp.]|nr:HAMP domain-containing histidine kinase [Lentimicrobium sp.]
MKKHSILLLILITSVSLAGIIFIQIYWVRNALRLQEEQFDNKIQLTLKSVVNRMFDERGLVGIDSTVCGEHCDRRTYNVLTSVNTIRLDSLLNEEFGGMEISKTYAWGVYNPGCGTIFAGNTGSYRSELITTNHHVSLSCLYQSEKLLLGVYFPAERNMLWLNIFPYLLLAFVLLGIVIFAFSYMIFSFLKQKKLSEMKSDFVNNMTHEFKTPISTISLASEMLLKPEVSESPARTRRYGNIIHDENLRLKQQVEQVLQIAILDKGEYRLSRKEFDAHEALKLCMKNFELTIRDKGGFMGKKLNATHSHIYADFHHFINMVNNLLDNAVKYSEAYPEIQIITKNIGGMFVVEVHDKGIGISSENIKYVFNKLYRVHTGNIHDVKGFGLGLYYVKTMAEAMGGSVKARSELKKGSIFEIHMPLRSEKNVKSEDHGSENENIAG